MATGARHLSSDKDLKHHDSNHHSNQVSKEGTYTSKHCHICDFKHKQQRKIEEHLYEDHDQKNCRDCGQSFENFNKYYKHRVQSHGEPIHCSECHLVFKSFLSYMYHRDKVHRTTTTAKKRWKKCEHCEFKCNFNSEMMVHVESKHPGTEEKRFLCDQCDYATDIFGKLNKHMKNVHEDYTKKSRKRKMFKCDYCKFKAHQLVTLTEHVECRHETKEFSCDQCEYTTRNPTEFSKHWKFRHDPNSKRIPCDQCHYSATRADALKFHIESVHEGKRVACSLCDYAAKSKGDLLKHTQNVHEKIRHKCEMCEFSCSDKFYLRRHVTAKHDNKNDPD